MIDPTYPRHVHVVGAQILEEPFRRNLEALSECAGPDAELVRKGCFETLAQLRNLCLEQFGGSRTVLHAIGDLERELHAHALTIARSDEYFKRMSDVFGLHV